MSAFTFAVYNLEANMPWEPFLVEATGPDEDEAARRVWAAAMKSLEIQGHDTSDAQVCCWRDGKPGPAVTADGIWK